MNAAQCLNVHRSDESGADDSCAELVNGCHKVAKPILILA